MLKQNRKEAAQGWKGGGFTGAPGAPLAPPKEHPRQPKCQKHCFWSKSLGFPASPVESRHRSPCLHRRLLPSAGEGADLTIPDPALALPQRLAPLEEGAGEGHAEAPRGPAPPPLPTAWFHLPFIALPVKDNQKRSTHGFPCGEIPLPTKSLPCVERDEAGAHESWFCCHITPPNVLPTHSCSPGHQSSRIWWILRLDCASSSPRMYRITGIPPAIEDQPETGLQPPNPALHQDDVAPVPHSQSASRWQRGGVPQPQRNNPLFLKRFISKRADAALHRKKKTR